MKRLILGVVLVLMAKTAFAPGTLDLDEISALLSQQPRIFRALTTGFEIQKTAIGVRLGNHFTHLGGKRIGPYTLWARPRGSAGPFDIEIQVCTSVTFLNSTGRATDDIIDAAQTKEVLRSFVVQLESGKVACPG
jgi:hypothetical protein